MIKLRFAALAALVALTACSSAQKADESGIQVENAWARLPALSDRPGAAYFTLRNNGPGAVLIGVQSPRVQRIELHDEAMSDSGMGGMMHMASVRDVAISQGSTAAFEPGGKHAMLFGMDPKLKEGEQLPLTFVFRDGPKVNAQAKLVAVGAPAP